VGHHIGPELVSIHVEGFKELSLQEEVHIQAVEGDIGLVEGHHGRHTGVERRKVVVGVEEDIQAGRTVAAEEDNLLVGRMAVPGADHMAVEEGHRKVPVAADSPAVVGVALAVVDRRANVVGDMENGLGEEDIDLGGMGLAGRKVAAPGMVGGS
jgi:pyrimidine operon attenuation protein/uracil phosphoribosyltransferase